MIAMGLRAQFRIARAQKKRESRTIRREGLSLYVDDQCRVRLYYQYTELTKYCGLSAAILAEGAWYSSVDAKAQVEKISAQEMRIVWKTQNAAMKQVWHVRLDPEGVIVWDVSVALDEPLRIDAGNARVFLSKAYSSWTIPLREGVFPEAFGSVWQPLDLTGQRRDFIGCMSLNPACPSVILKNSQTIKGELGIFNSDLKLSCRVLTLQFESAQEHYQTGTHRYLETVIQVYPDKAILGGILHHMRQEVVRERLRQEEALRKEKQERKRQEEEALRKEEQERKRQEEEALRKQQEEERLRQEEALRKEEQERKSQEEDLRLRTLQAGPLRIFFDHQSRFHFYYNDQELTKEAGLRAGMLSEGSWYGAFDAQCQIEKPSEDTMRLVLTHHKLPLTQIWHLRLKPEGLLSWDVEMHLREPLRIDRMDAALFLSKIYESWVFPSQEGAFPASFGPAWQMMHTSQDGAEFMGLAAALPQIPGITLKNLMHRDRARLLIQSTDFKLASRVLELQFDSQQEYYSAGTYPYLKAVIAFHPDKAFLDDIVTKIRRQQEEERLRQEEALRKEEQ
ncbi:MAG TPA: hypothetical protein VMD52_04750, partial [Patescibacteria group bacterium]|nr:hypothetical protein [Patescibacteria group bacterium]